MKLWLLNLLVFYSFTASSQEVVEEPKKADQTINLPAPIEIEVPYYRARTPVEQVNNTLKESVFFLELNPLRISGGSFDFTSDLTTLVKPDLEADMSMFNLNLLPLDFKFGFINSDWGSFGEINLQEDNQNSEWVIFANSNGHKFGAGFGADISKEKITVKSNGVLLGKGETKSTDISAYFYSSFKLVDNNLLSIEQWNKIGGGYQRLNGDDLSLKGLYLRIEPAIELMFKINNRLQFGTGFELRYDRFAGHVYVGSLDLKGISNSINYEFNLIKTRFTY